jgi:hypothetical protein
MRRERPPASRAAEKGYGEEFKGPKESRSAGVQEVRRLGVQKKIVGEEMLLLCLTE